MLGSRVLIDQIERTQHSISGEQHENRSWGQTLLITDVYFPLAGVVYSDTYWQGILVAQSYRKFCPASVFQQPQLPVCLVLLFSNNADFNGTRRCCQNHIPVFYVAQVVMVLSLSAGAKKQIAEVQKPLLSLFIFFRQRHDHKLWWGF